jgi:hypothetical protein
MFINKTFFFMIIKILLIKPVYYGKLKFETWKDRINSSYLLSTREGVVLSNPIPVYCDKNFWVQYIHKVDHNCQQRFSIFINMQTTTC